MWVLIAVILLIILLLGYLWGYRPGVRILMYHNVDSTRKDALTVTADQLRQQLTYLQNDGYTYISFADLLHAQANPNARLPRKAALITFDDAYANNLTYALPVLKALQLPATIFVPMAFVGQTNIWDGGDEPLLTAQTLIDLTAQGISLGYHSYRHINYATASAADIQADIDQMVADAKRQQLPMLPVLAYAYGGRPSDESIRIAMYDSLRKAGIQLACRIGNRINRWPLQNPNELNRLDIRGTDSMAAFRRKVRWGKLV